MAIALSSFSTSCVSKVPVKEYALAEAAIQAAQDVQAARHASGIWFEAEQSYKKAVQAYNQRDFKEAEELFTQARKIAEEAETTARQEMLKTGDFNL